MWIVARWRAPQRPLGKQEIPIAEASGNTGGVGPQVARYSERPELWDARTGLSDEVWAEYNQHGATLNHYWDQLYEVFPGWQFVLYDPGDETVLAEGHTIPVAWDGTDTGLGPGIDATVAAAFELRAAGGRPTAVSALAAEIPPRHQRRGLAKVMLQAMASLARDAGLAHLIAPVRPTLKDRYPTIPIERYARWTRPDGTPFDPWMRVHTQLGARIGPAIPRSLHIVGTVGDWESWTGMRFPETGDYVFPAGLATVHIDRVTATSASTGNRTSGSSTTSAAGHRADRTTGPGPCQPARRPPPVLITEPGIQAVQPGQAWSPRGKAHGHGRNRCRWHTRIQHPARHDLYQPDGLPAWRYPPIWSAT